MSVQSTGWFRWHRRAASASPPGYPRIVSAEEENAPPPADFELFDFDSLVPANWRNARVEDIVPARVAAAREVLWLALRATWPTDHPLAGALATAWQEQTGESAPPPVGIWHLSPGRGLQGYLNDCQVLIGNEQLIRDGGIALPDAIRTATAEFAARGWQAVFVGARTCPPDREDVHCSLIGVLAVAPGGRTQEPTTASVESSAPAAPTPALQSLPAPAAREGPPHQPPPRRRRLPWRVIGALALISAALGVYESALTVAPDEVVIVRRWGNVAAVCQPGLHFRSMWPVERITRIRPHGTRLLHLEWGGNGSGERHVRAAVEYCVGEQDADRIAYASAPAGAEDLFARIAEGALRESLAASAVPELSLDWQRRMQERLAALAMGLVVINAPIFTIDRGATTMPGEAASNYDRVEQAQAAAAQAVEEAQAQASKTRADAWAAAEQMRSEAAAEATASAEAALREAGRLLARCGGAGASLETARLKLIQEAMDDQLPGRRSFVIDPTLGARCRMYLLKGSGLQAASLWTWPASQPAAVGEDRP